jgi:Arc/MetJ-type ribon-helix-helix transcriptional regulator
MKVEISPEIESKVRDLITRGLYSNEAEVFKAAIDALEHEERDLDAIRRGIEDEAAGRLTPARQVIEAAKQRSGHTAK